MSRDRALLLLKIVGSALCLGILGVRYGGDAELKAALLQMNPISYALAAAGLALGLVLSAHRWRTLLRSVGVSVRMPEATRLCFVGYFWSAFLPTSIGGDVVRAVSLRHLAPLSTVGSSILMERLLGFTCLLTLALLGSFGLEALAPVRPALALASVGFLAAGALFFFGPIDRIRIPPGPLSSVVDRAIRLAAETQQFRSHGASVSKALGISLIWQCLLVAIHAVLSAGLGGSISWMHLIILVPVVQALAMLPFSIGGLGVREIGYEYFYRLAGYDPGEGVALGLGWLAVSLTIALFGGVLFALRSAQREEVTP